MQPQISLLHKKMVICPSALMRLVIFILITNKKRTINEANVKRENKTAGPSYLRVLRHLNPSPRNRLVA